MKLIFTQADKSWRPDKISYMSGNPAGANHIREFRTDPEVLVKSISDEFSSVLENAEDAVTALKKKLKNQVENYDWLNERDYENKTWDKSSYDNAGFLIGDSEWG